MSLKKVCITKFIKIQDGRQLRMGIANCVGGGGELNALNKALLGGGGLPLACLSMQYILWKIFILRYRLIQPWLVLRVFQCSEDVIKNMY